MPRHAGRHGIRAVFDMEDPSPAAAAHSTSGVAVFRAAIRSASSRPYRCEPGMPCNARRSAFPTSARTVEKPSAPRSWAIASTGAVEFAQGGGELGGGHRLAQGGHLGVGPDIAALVERVPGVALEPAPFDRVRGSPLTSLTNKNT